MNFNFGTAIPSGTALTAATTYSVAWSGQIEPQYSELYTFTVTADDGARLWVDDQMIVCRTFYQAPGELRGQIRLKAGHRVNLRMEYIQASGQRVGETGVGLGLADRNRWCPPTGSIRQRKSPTAAR